MMLAISVVVLVLSIIILISGIVYVNINGLYAVDIGMFILFTYLAVISVKEIFC